MSKFVSFVVLNLLCLLKFALPQATYQCGIRVSLVGRGSQVERGLWPWHVAVFRRKERDEQFKYYCGGTLISERHILTAALCVVDHKDSSSFHVDLYEFQVHLGQYNLSEVSDSVMIRGVTKAYVHPNFQILENDIAVLVMQLSVKYSDAVIPICLPQNADDVEELVGQRGWITGWRKMENGAISEVLRMISLPVISHEKCIQSDWALATILHEHVFCAGKNSGTKPGEGDGGGGIYISDGDRWLLRGIVFVTSENSVYTTFLSVQPYLTWIEDILAKNETRQDFPVNHFTNFVQVFYHKLKAKTG